MKKASMVIELVLVFVTVNALAIGVIALFGFLMADFLMLPVIAASVAVAFVCFKTAGHLMSKRLGL